jgi:hypothetical protein
MRRGRVNDDHVNLPEGVFVKALAACIVLSLAFATPALAQGTIPALQPIAFLLGEWDQGQGQVGDAAGTTSKGGSIFTLESDGAAIIRRDHTELFDKTGKQTGGFHQTMLIYSDANAIRADYVDGGGRTIHYTSTTAVPGKLVTFLSAAGQGPQFKLTYELTAPGTLSVNFVMLPPGQSGQPAQPERPIATGTLKKVK